MLPDTVTSGAAPLAERTRTLHFRGQPTSLMSVGGTTKTNGTETKATAEVLMVATGAAGAGASGLKTSMTTGTDSTTVPGGCGNGFKEPLMETSVLPGTFNALFVALLVGKGGNTGLGPN